MRSAHFRLLMYLKSTTNTLSFQAAECRLVYETKPICDKEPVEEFERETGAASAPELEEPRELEWMLAYTGAEAETSTEIRDVISATQYQVPGNDNNDHVIEIIRVKKLILNLTKRLYLKLFLTFAVSSACPRSRAALCPW